MTLATWEMVVALACVLGLTLGGCSTTNLAEIIAAAAKDPATVCARVTSVYGTATMLRTNITAGDVSCDTLTVKSTPPSVPVNLQVVPVSK